MYSMHRTFWKLQGKAHDLMLWERENERGEDTSRHLSSASLAHEDGSMFMSGPLQQGLEAAARMMPGLHRYLEKQMHKCLRASQAHSTGARSLIKRTFTGN